MGSLHRLCAGLLAATTLCGHAAWAQSARFVEAERAQYEEQNPRLAERKRRLEAERAACVMPKASAAAKVILLGGATSDALSSTTLGSQDVAISAGSIAIEPGAEPLYLVVTTHEAVIWRLRGAVDRIERLVLATATSSMKDGTGVPLVGAAGLPRDKVAVLRGTYCIGYFFKAPSDDAVAVSAKVAEGAGKAVDIVIGRSVPGNISLPSGAVNNDDKVGREPLFTGKASGTLSGAAAVQAAAIERLADDFQRSKPGGVIAIDPVSVVSLASAQPYEVLPQQAGLVQLLKSGALTKNLSGELLIREKIRFPANLPDLHGVNFLLLKGVPEPDGDPGPMQIFSEETGQPLKKR